MAHRIEYIVRDEGKCDVEWGEGLFDKHFQQRCNGWLGQGWSIHIWPKEGDDDGHTD